jgi:hypothetical protein
MGTTPKNKNMREIMREITRFIRQLGCNLVVICGLAGGEVANAQGKVERPVFGIDGFQLCAQQIKAPADASKRHTVRL